MRSLVSMLRNCDPSIPTLFAAAHVYIELLGSFTQLETVCFAVSSHSADSYQLGWDRLVGATARLPRSVRLLILKIIFHEEAELLRGVADLRRSFETIVVERRPSAIVSVRPDATRPMLDIHEQTKVKEFFPRLVADNLLSF